MTQSSQDFMAICRHFYKPDLFFTMTANPKQPEITQSLFPGQIATDCPDIVLWVFKQKKKALIKLIDHGFFGTTMTYIYTIASKERSFTYLPFILGMECWNIKLTL